jgi:hypothetical protein
MVEPSRHSEELNMKGILLAPLSGGTLMATNFLVSAVTMAFGTFVAASPHRAARIWGSQRLAKLTPERRSSLIRWYRTFGILLRLSCMLLAVDGIGFSSYHR